MLISWYQANLPISNQAQAIDNLTRDEVCRLLASLEVNVEKLMEYGTSVEELRKKYRKMLAHQLREFKEGDTCMLPVWAELRQSKNTINYAFATIDELFLS